MKIAAVVPLYPPASRVGAWLATHEFLAHLVRQGHRVQVRRKLGGKHPGYTLDGVEVIGPNDNLEPADVLISHATGQDAAVAFAKEHRIPHVRFVHGPGSDLPIGADVVVVSSQAAADQFNGEAVVCRPPTWPEAHRGERGSAVTLVNLSRAKGVNTAWKAAERLPDVEFLGVRGGYGSQQKPRAKNFTTIDTQRDMRAVWSRTRVLLMPSKSETWGMVGVEAMCSGIPVIAHPSPGLIESLGDAGIFVDRDDIAGWVQAITALQDPDRYAEASAAAERRFAEIDPYEGLNRFTDMIERLV